MSSHAGIDDSDLPEVLSTHLHPLTGAPGDHDALLALIGTARFALLGEASHGTEEFYRERAAITRRLIEEKRFRAVAVEGDWPDAWRVNRYVRGLGGDADAAEALSGFRRFPAWMWRNTVLREFVEWLRAFNAERDPADQVGFYGIDLYSLFASIQAVLAYLDRIDPAAAREARERYACFDPAGGSSQAYGRATRLGLAPDCEQEVVRQLRELHETQLHAAELRAGRGADRGFARDAAFDAEQNARLVRNAEAYYRTMFRGGVASWNQRDSHMVETLLALERHLDVDAARRPRIAVWAHNSHLGDASATELGARGEWNVGQLMRERRPGDTVLVGFSTHHGFVTASSDWDRPAEHKAVRPGLPGSWEETFHRVGVGRFMLPLRGNEALRRHLPPQRLQRAIGVIYRPETERRSHYFQTRLADQFDAMVHIDETRALRPLDRGAVVVEQEAPETYPFAV